MHAKNCQGNILIVALILIVVVSGLVVVALNVTDNSAHFADRSRDLVSAQAAAEGAVDHAFAIWKRRINSQNRAINTTEANANLAAPAFTDFAYATVAEDGPLKIDALDEYGAPVTNPTRVTVDLEKYPGWRGNSYSYSARAKVKQSGVTNGPAVGVKRQFQYSEVPLFQAMFFFENTLEFYKPAAMIVSGLVHTNDSLYASYENGSSLTFQDEVSYVNSYSSTLSPTGAEAWSASGTKNPPIYPDGIATQLHQVPRFEPLGSEPASVLSNTDSNPNNDSFRELIEPPNTSFTDPPEIAQRRLYNKAGLRININGSTVTVTGQNGTTATSVAQSAIAGAIASFTTIYDAREGKNVDVATLDISTLRVALGTGITGFNNVIYVNDTTPLVSGNTEPKTIRLINGGILPSGGLTVASENAVYIQGDYNTGTTTDPNAVPSNNGGNAGNTKSPTVTGYERKPAAVIGDAVMLLSNSWNDANSATFTSRTATNTTYNTAIVSGFMPSGYHPPSGSDYGYSGGGNNFPRFLENWSNQYCSYFGSMVQLYQSKTFTGRWTTNNIYRPPNRCWNFDTNFRNSPPPGTLDAASWSRGTWAKY